MRKESKGDKKGKPKIRQKNKKNDQRFGIWMIMPAFILMILLLLYPVVQGIAYSFMDYRLNRPDKKGFVFLQNFIKLITTDDKFYNSFGFTLLNAIGVVLISYTIGFAIAMLLNQKVVGRGVFRALILLPWIISSSVTATNWKWILNERYGIVNIILQKTGIIDEPILFLARPENARLVVILLGAWKTLPFMTIVILAGLQSVSMDLYESAAIDGAGFLKSLRYITLPGIRKVTLMCTTLQFIWTFNNFENIYLLTEGGPNDATYILPVYIYQQAFARNNISYASAIAVTILILMIIFTIIRFRLQREED